MKAGRLAGRQASWQVGKESSWKACRNEDTQTDRQTVWKSDR